MRCAGPAERSPRAQLCPLWDRAVMLAGRPCGRRKRAVRAFKGRQACSAARLPQSERASGEAEPGAGLEGASLQAGAEAACWLVSARLRRPSACSTAQMQRVCSAARARGARRCTHMDVTMADAAAGRGAHPRSLPPRAPWHLQLRLSCAHSRCRRAGRSACRDQAAPGHKRKDAGVLLRPCYHQDGVRTFLATLRKLHTPRLSVVSSKGAGGQRSRTCALAKV